MSIITFIVKSIATLFLFTVAAIIFVLWLIFGTIMLIALLLRLITLYTIALLNSFISGTSLTQDYTAAIEEAIDMYLTRYGKILSMPKLPWHPLQPDSISNVGGILKTELVDIKKNWIISIVVFITYILSIGLGTSYFIFKSNGGFGFAKEEHERIFELEQSINTLNQNIKIMKGNEFQIIQDLYKNHHVSIPTLSKAYKIPHDSIKQIVISDIGKY